MTTLTTLKLIVSVTALALAAGCTSTALNSVEATGGAAGQAGAVATGGEAGQPSGGSAGQAGSGATGGQAGSGGAAGEAGAGGTGSLGGTAGQAGSGATGGQAGAAGSGATGGQAGAGGTGGGPACGSPVRGAAADGCSYGSGFPFEYGVQKEYKDGVQNTGLGETDVDCGGSCNPVRCTAGQSCSVNGDCLSGSCGKDVPGTCDNTGDDQGCVKLFNGTVCCDESQGGYVPNQAEMASCQAQHGMPFAFSHATILVNPPAPKAGCAKLDGATWCCPDDQFL